MQARMRLSGGCYHVMSRCVAGERFLESKRQKKVFYEIMRKVAAFCGVEIFTYCIMTNHFHILVGEPQPQEVADLSDEELLKRVLILYGHGYRSMVEEQMKSDEGLKGLWRKKLRARMGNISVFMKELKQRYSIWYNKHHQRIGTLWAEPFKSVLVEGKGNAFLTMAAYIDLNPVRAGLVCDPKDYSFSGYGEAVAGGRDARDGLSQVVNNGESQVLDWKEASAEYRKLLYYKGQSSRHPTKEVISQEALEEVIAKGGKLELSELLKCRVRYFVEGAALGSREFVEKVFAHNRQKFPRTRKSGARKMKGAIWSNLHVIRQLQKQIITAMR